MRKRIVLLGTVLTIFVMAGCSTHQHSYRYMNTLPPPPHAEEFRMAPRPGFVWIGGYWRWQGRDYIWIPGRWAHPPRRGAAWVPGNWEHRHNRYIWHEGYWR